MINNNHLLIAACPYANFPLSINKLRMNNYNGYLLIAAHPYANFSLSINN
jgi:hypothetical protein